MIPQVCITCGHSPVMHLLGALTEGIHCKEDGCTCDGSVVFPSDTLDRCSICGDPGEPALCPDRHGWEDHCLTCVGKCPYCEPQVRGRWAS